MVSEAFSEMNNPLEIRREIARQIDYVLGGLPEVSSAYVVGSVASGHVDERSDVDITILCHPEIHPLSVRKDVLSPVGSEWQFDIRQRNQIWDSTDSGLVDGINVEVLYQSASFISAVLDEVTNNGAITTQKIPFRPYTVVGMLQRAWLLRDKEGIFRGWLEQTRVYPQVLKLNLLREFVPILREYTDDLVSYAERHLGPGLFLFVLVRAKDALTRILFALNEVYDPAEKRELNLLSSLALLPRDFMTRLNYILEGPFDGPGAIERAHLFEELTNEALKMAEPHMR
jgi:predicted nucleotidyltransferase